MSLHFPQHREGLLPEHGFADSMLWEVEGAVGGLAGARRGLTVAR